MKQIKLTQGKFTLVDDKDFEWLNQWKWHYLNIGYAARRDLVTRKYIYMHRLIIEQPTDYLTDHINRNKLDNRRENLRLVTKSQNMMNTDLRKTNKSGYRGVCWDKNRNKWMVEITINYKNINLGRFKDKLDAAHAYDLAAKKYFGKFARLNLL